MIRWIVKMVWRFLNWPPAPLATSFVSAWVSVLLVAMTDNGGLWEHWYVRGPVTTLVGALVGTNLLLYLHWTMLRRR